MYDVIIIGAGPAGLSAGIYASRSGLNALILDKASWGGQVMLSAEIENYPAVPAVTGPDFAEKLYNQLVKIGGTILIKEVTEIDLHKKTVVTKDETYRGKTIIIATGLKRRNLNCPGESAFQGKGVSYCAICDGRFFTGKDVVVVGGGNTAMEDALYMSPYCNNITILCRSDSLKGEDALRQGIAAKENIQVKFNVNVAAINGDKTVESVSLDNGEEVKTSGVFIAIGYEADSNFLQGQIDLSDQGYVLAGEDCKTSLEGVYVAGDIRVKKVRQIITAAADGAVAALEAANYVVRM